MKISLSTKSQSGSVLVVCLVISGLLGLTLLTVLNMVSSERTIIARTEAWNSAIPISEAGVEDAMAHLNYHGTTDLASDGWTLSNNKYTRQNTFGDGYYVASISTSSPPIIVSQGFIHAPAQTTYINRQVQVKTRRNGRFPKAVLTKGPITTTGHAEIASFNSTNALYNTGGKYDPNKKSANAGVATTSSAPGSINLGGGDIYGSVGTAPGGSVTPGQGGVGDVAWNTLGNSGIQDGHISADVSVDIDDASLPFSPSDASTPTIGKYLYDSTTYKYSLGNGDYVLPSLKMTSKEGVVITGKVRLYISGSLDMSGQSTIYLAPGASLELYVGGPTASIEGGGIINASDGASSLSIFGLPGVTSVTCGGNSGFTGTIYAPEADVKIDGTADFTGAVVANSFTMAGTGNMYYDEALGGPSGYKFVVNSWQEDF
ncbi:MAG: hypothetical protein JWQ71_1931 [Pedosphaera sp.]|nr:hypothetical protein [Pedosphaera sp.]